MVCYGVSYQLLLLPGRQIAFQGILSSGGAIATLHTKPEHRRKGHARHLVSGFARHMGSSSMEHDHAGIVPKQ